MQPTVSLQVGLRGRQDAANGGDTHGGGGRVCSGARTCDTRGAWSWRRGLACRSGPAGRSSRLRCQALQASAPCVCGVTTTSGRMHGSSERAAQPAPDVAGEETHRALEARGLLVMVRLAHAEGAGRSAGVGDKRAQLHGVFDGAIAMREVYRPTAAESRAAEGRQRALVARRIGVWTRPRTMEGLEALLQRTCTHRTTRHSASAWSLSHPTRV